MTSVMSPAPTKCTPQQIYVKPGALEYHHAKPLVNNYRYCAHHSWLGPGYSTAGVVVRNYKEMGRGGGLGISGYQATKTRSAHRRVATESVSRACSDLRVVPLHSRKSGGV